MNTQPRKLVLATGIALAITLMSSVIIAKPISQEITEARQESQIWTTYALSPYLRAHNIDVAVKNGQVTLTGVVEEDVNKDLATQIAKGVHGIDKVDNQIVVKADYVPTEQTTERSYGDKIDDATTTAAVKSRLLWSKHSEGLATNVDTLNGNVTLRGTANSGAAKELAGSLARNTKGVISVDNQLVVDKATPDAASNAQKPQDEPGSKIADTWITTKVKSTFMYSSNVKSHNISVDTNQGIVTLSGKVDSGAEHALAVELAENIRGVNSVEHSDLTN